MIGPIKTDNGAFLCPYCGEPLTDGELISEHDSRFVFRPNERLKKKIIIKSRTLFTSVKRKAKRCSKCRIIIMNEE